MPDQTTPWCVCNAETCICRTYQMRPATPDVNADLLSALKALRNEVVGVLGLQIDGCIGRANVRCLRERCQQADEAIRKAEE
jgi:hypothetical protein